MADFDIKDFTTKMSPTANDFIIGVDENGVGFKTGAYGTNDPYNDSFITISGGTAWGITCLRRHYITYLSFQTRTAAIQMPVNTDTLLLSTLQPIYRPSGGEVRQTITMYNAGGGQYDTCHISIYPDGGVRLIINNPQPRIINLSNLYVYTSYPTY